MENKYRDCEMQEKKRLATEIPRFIYSTTEQKGEKKPKTMASKKYGSMSTGHLQTTRQQTFE